MRRLEVVTFHTLRVFTRMPFLNFHSRNSVRKVNGPMTLQRSPLLFVAPSTLSNTDVHTTVAGRRGSTEGAACALAISERAAEDISLKL